MFHSVIILGNLNFGLTDSYIEECILRYSWLLAHTPMPEGHELCFRIAIFHLLCKYGLKIASIPERQILGCVLLMKTHLLSILADIWMLP